MTDLLRDVHNQVMWNRLISVVEEQALTLVRTAFSVSVREAGDLSAGVFDRVGRMLAQAVTGTPGHVNAMAAAVGNFIREIGEPNIYEGDIYFTNDPWLGTGHLLDFTFVTPSFRDGRLVGYFACTAHVVDVGGRGFGPDAKEIYEEGIFVPICKFAERGTVDEKLVRLIRYNVREPDQVVGDLYSLAACNEIGHRRLMDMMDEFGLDDLDGLAAFIFDHSRRATLERLSALAPGSYANTMTVDGYGDPVNLSVRLDVSAQGVHADFDGTSGVSPKEINVPVIYTVAYCCFGLKCALAPDIPNNHASLEPFTVTAPKGSILNAEHPAPVAVRHVLGHFLPDTVFGAVAQFLPDVAPAEGAGSLWNVHISARPIPGAQAGPGERMQSAEMLLFSSGGSGARPTRDGMNATAFPSGVMGMSIEALEQTGPVVFWRKELREGSGGPGKYRGGLGQVIEIGAADGHHFHFNAMFDRVRPSPPGDGPAAAPERRAVFVSTTARRCAQRAGNTCRRSGASSWHLPGGGGFGDQASRNPVLAETDRRRGYVKDAKSSA